MKTILLPTDFSDNSWKAIEYALQLFKNETCNFYIMHALDSMVSAPSTGVTSRRASQAIYDSRINSSKDDLAKLLQKVQDYSNNPKHTFETKLVNGSLIAAVKAFSETTDVQLAIIGNKGATALQKVTFGSNATQLILKLSCPIIAVPDTVNVVDDMTEIGFATDYTIENFGGGLNLMKEIALSNNAILSVVNVVSSSSDSIPGLKSKRETLENAFKPVQLEYYTLTDVPVELGIKVFSESRKIDMLALITKRRSFFEKLTTKSHSKAISHNINVPLLVFDQRSF